jgi:hypothetical protein
VADRPPAARLEDVPQSRLVALDVAAQNRGAGLAARVPLGRSEQRGHDLGVERPRVDIEARSLLGAHVEVAHERAVALRHLDPELRDREPAPDLLLAQLRLAERRQGVFLEQRADRRGLFHACIPQLEAHAS